MTETGDVCGSIYQNLIDAGQKQIDCINFLIFMTL